MLSLDNMKNLILDIEEFLIVYDLSENDFNNICGDYTENCNHYDNGHYAYYDLMNNFIICYIDNHSDKEINEYVDNHEDIHFYTKISKGRMYMNIMEEFYDEKFPFPI